MVANDEETVVVKRSDLRAMLVEMQKVASDDDRATELSPRRGATGQDARILAEAVRIEVDRAKVDLMRDVRDAIREATKDFLPSENITRAIEDAFDDIGLPIDKEHRRETAEAMRGMVKWQRRIDKVLGGMALAVVTAALYGLARLAGINLPSPGVGK